VAVANPVPWRYTTRDHRPPSEAQGMTMRSMFQ